MANLILLFLCLFLGVFIKKINVLPANAHQTINLFLIYVSLPFLTLYYLPKIVLSTHLLYPILVPWVQILVAFFLYYLLGKKWGWSKSLVGALTLCTGFGNTSFLGIPIINALYGEEGIKTVILVDQPGSFVAISTIGIAIAGFYSKGKNSLQQVLLQILKFPPFYAFIMGVFINIFHISVPPSLNEAFFKIGATIVPLAMFSVGLQLNVQKHSRHWKFVWLGLSYKLIISPLLFFVMYMLLLQQRGKMIEISILEAGMAPMVTAVVIASSYGLKPQFSNLLLGIGIPLSLITLGLWYLLLQFF